MSARRRLVTAVLLGGALLGAPSVAGAQDKDGARRAYDAASEAFGRKAYAEAAAGYLVADELAPNPVAVESALKAALLADDPVLAMRVVERAESRSSSDRVLALSKRARGQFEAKVARVTPRCPDERACSATVAGAAAEPGKPVWVQPGTVVVETDVGGAKTVTTIEVLPGDTREARPPSPPRPPPADPPPGSSVTSNGTAGVKPSEIPKPPPAPPDAKKQDDGISPAWFIVGAVATAALTAVTIWSGVDTLDKHAAFQDGDDDAKEPGRDAQLRTNILLGATLASGAGTAITAIFVDWGGSDPDAAAGARSAFFPHRLSVRLRF